VRPNSVFCSMGRTVRCNSRTMLENPEGDEKLKEIYEVSAYETTAATFFTTLIEHKTSLVLDVRLKNESQLCGFTKKRDLEYLISQITQAKYIHDLEFAPTPELLERYIGHWLDWEQYAVAYQALLEQRNALLNFKRAYLPYDSICLLGTATRKRRSHSSVLFSLLQGSQCL